MYKFLEKKPSNYRLLRLDIASNTIKHYKGPNILPMWKFVKRTHSTFTIGKYTQKETKILNPRHDIHIWVLNPNYWTCMTLLSIIGPLITSTYEYEYQ